MMLSWYITRVIVEKITKAVKRHAARQAYAAAQARIWQRRARLCYNTRTVSSTYATTRHDVPHVTAMRGMQDANDASHGARHRRLRDEDAMNVNVIQLLWLATAI